MRILSTILIASLLSATSAFAADMGFSTVGGLLACTTLRWNMWTFWFTLG